MRRTSRRIPSLSAIPLNEIVQMPGSRPVATGHEFEWKAVVAVLAWMGFELHSHPDALLP